MKFHPIADLFPLLEGTEFEQFKADIAENGLLEPIWLYEGQILDGRNRYRACEMLGIEPEYREWQGDDPEVFVISMNLHRRHLDREQRKQLVYHLRQKEYSYRAIGEMVGVGKSTVERDLSTVPDGTVDLPTTIVGRDGKVRPATKKQWTNLALRQADIDFERTVPCLECPYCGHAKWTEDWLDDMEWPGEIECNNCYCKFTYDEESTRGGFSHMRKLATEEWDGKVRPAVMPTKEDESELSDTPPPNGMAIHYSSESPEWYTPQHIVDHVIMVLGEIDLDPCSNSKESPNVPAKHHFTVEDDGLIQPWHGRVYMNPPYGDEIENWVKYLCEQWEQDNIDEAIALVPARTDTRWFRVLREFPRCFIWGRLKFSGNGTSAPFPSVAIYLGNNLDRFKRVFSDIGDTYIWIGD